MRALVIAMAALGLAAEAHAQWDAPSFMPPRPGDDIGVYLSDVGDFAIQGIWRQRGNMNLGVRLGYADIGADGAILVGAETWNTLFSAGPDFPVDVSWTLGAGALFNGGTALEIPGGLTVGRAFVLTPISFQVYGHPRLALYIFGDVPEGQDAVELEALFDIGADVFLSESLKLRIGATVGGSDALGVGLAWRWGRGVEVR